MEIIKTSNDTEVRVTKVCELPNLSELSMLRGDMFILLDQWGKQNPTTLIEHLNTLIDKANQAIQLIDS